MLIQKLYIVQNEERVIFTSVDANEAKEVYRRALKADRAHKQLHLAEYNLNLVSMTTDPVTADDWEIERCNFLLKPRK